MRFVFNIRDGSLFMGRRGPEILIFEAAKNKCPPHEKLFWKFFLVLVLPETREKMCFAGFFNFLRQK